MCNEKNRINIEIDEEKEEIYRIGERENRLMTRRRRKTEKGNKMEKKEEEKKRRRRRRRRKRRRRRWKGGIVNQRESRWEAVCL